MSRPDRVGAILRRRRRLTNRRVYVRHPKHRQLPNPRVEIGAAA